MVRSPTFGGSAGRVSVLGFETSIAFVAAEFHATLLYSPAGTCRVMVVSNPCPKAKGPAPLNRTAVTVERSTGRSVDQSSTQPGLSALGNTSSRHGFEEAEYSMTIPGLSEFAERKVGRNSLPRGTRDWSCETPVSPTWGRRSYTTAFFMTSDPTFDHVN